MIAPQPLYKKRSFWLTIVTLIFIVLFWRSFRLEICVLFTGKLCGQSPESKYILTPLRAMWVLGETLGVFLVTFLIAVLMVSQFVLPVQTFRERWMVFKRLALYALHMHGPAVFIKEGKQKARAEELKSVRPGVAFVDLSSAMVLEKRWRSTMIQNDSSSSSIIMKLFRRYILNKPESSAYQTPMVRAVGPGIAFTKYNERILGIADLRRQVRYHRKVLAYTSDGIEVESNIVAIFSLGMPPEVLKVAYIKSEELKDSENPKDWEKPENLRVIQVEKKIEKDPNTGLWRSVECVRGFSDDFDSGDRAEIHRFASDKAALCLFIDDLGPIEPELILNFIDSLNPWYKAAIYRFVGVLYLNDKAALYRFIDKLSPVERPGTYRFIINKATVHRFIDELEQYQTDEERQLITLRRSDKIRIHSFINQLFSKHQNRVIELVNGLDSATREIIIRFVRTYGSSQEFPQPPASGEKPPSQSPYVFDEKRVFGAIYARGRNVKVGTLDDWTRLPEQIGIDLFRHELSQINYDYISMPDDPNRFPLFDEIKPRFRRIMQHSGVLSYQFMRRRDKKPISIGDELNNIYFNLDYPIQELHQSKPLRDRGIRIFFCNFSEPKSVEVKSGGVVHQQRLDNWRARWQKEIEMIKAETDLEIMRIRNRARAQAQRDMTIALSQIFQDTSHSQEAMAVRIFQALETAATDPTTRQLLPRDTIDMLRSLRHWLLPGEGDQLSTLLAGEDLSDLEDE
jgi:hypothetical protein